MTINNEHKEKSPMPNLSHRFDEQEDETPRRIPIPPRHHSAPGSLHQNGRTPSARHMAPTQQQGPVVSQQPIWTSVPSRPMPAQQYVVGTGWQTTTAYPMPAQQYQQQYRSFSSQQTLVERP